MKVRNYFILLSANVLCIPHHLFAQPGKTDEPQLVPLAAIEILIFLGSALGVKKIYDRIRKH